MDEIRFPNWHDVGIPVPLVHTIKLLRGEQLLEQLIYDRVFHNTRRLQYVYVCGVCGHQHKAEKSTEDYGQCEKCKSKAIRVTQHLRGWNPQHPPGCSNTDDFAREVMVKMRENYAVYFNRHVDDFPPEEVVLFRWKQHGFVANYQSGDQAEEPTTSRALCKAALLVPFIWDYGFDWKTKSFKPQGRKASILPTLFEWVQRG
jgi:DNA-directed RNA polymerase subunit RPC12/RpoP